MARLARPVTAAVSIIVDEHGVRALTDQTVDDQVWIDILAGRRQVWQQSRSLQIIVLVLREQSLLRQVEQREGRMSCVVLCGEGVVSQAFSARSRLS